MAAKEIRFNTDARDLMRQGPDESREAPPNSTVSLNSQRHQIGRAHV